MDEKIIDGVVISSSLMAAGQRLEGKFAITSETRKRYGVDATSIGLEYGDGRTLKVEMDTADLIEALIAGGITAGDLRLYADIADDVTVDGTIVKGSDIPGRPKGGDPRATEPPRVPGAMTNEWE